ncbi:MAG: 4Fe-4S dicluster domain-containing protein [Deltaproteobacteria bacterium]|nr:4Fe-4S dicluster domain-containing protein [Deltaproteobacteria bacterium]
MPYDVTTSDYFRPERLEAELKRVFSICHGCRLCFDLCPAFVSVFDRVDPCLAAGAVGIDALTEADLAKVVSLCDDCKLCTVHCPNLPPHPHDVDFPRLMLRGRAVLARQRGVDVRANVWARPDVVGRLGSFFAPLANALAGAGVARFVVEKVAGVDREHQPAPFAPLSFGRWFASARRSPAPTAAKGAAGAAAKVALFPTCGVDYHEVGVGKALTQVLWHHGVEVAIPRVRCCGAPHLQVGDVEGAVAAARKNVRALIGLVDQGYLIVVPDPTCSFTLKDDYPKLLATPEAARVAAHTLEACEYLMRLHGEGKLRTDFVAGAGHLGYHAASHLQAQKIGLKSRDLLALMPDTTVSVVESGRPAAPIWGMQKAHVRMAERMARGLCDDMLATAATSYASDCPAARLAIARGTGRQARHPVEILRDAYGLKAAD